MSAQVESIARMISQLARLPGIGQKTAQRLAYHIISLPEQQVRELADAIYEGKTQTEISEEVGISQAQVSRLEKNALNNIRINIS